MSARFVPVCLLVVCAANCDKPAPPVTSPTAEEPVRVADLPAVTPGKQVEELKKQIEDKKRELAKLEGEAAKLAPVKWAKLGEWVQVGDFRVRVVSAAVKKPLIRIADVNKPQEDREESFVLTIELHNTSKTRKFYYPSWGRGRFPQDSGRATDEHGNTYKINARDHRVGGVFYADSRPDEPPFQDVICFERPVGAATEFWVTLDDFQTGDAPRGDAMPKFRFKDYRTKPERMRITHAAIWHQPR